MDVFYQFENFFFKMKILEMEEDQKNYLQSIEPRLESNFSNGRIFRNGTKECKCRVILAQVKKLKVTLHTLKNLHNNIVCVFI